jgi:hypothetical protein
MRKEELPTIEDDILDDLPIVLRQVSDVLGVAVACRLAMDFGGREIYIPAKLADRHPLIKSLGRPAAEKLIALFGPGALEIPLGPTTFDARMASAIRERLDRGESEAKIARALRIHIRTVRRHRAKMRDDHPRLFD